MAKSTIRKSNPENTTTPARRRGTTASESAPASTPNAATRTRRKAEKPVELVAADSSTTVGLTHEQIALRAYQLFLERRGHTGDQFRDWVTAERELREQLGQAHS